MTTTIIAGITGLVMAFIGLAIGYLIRLKQAKTRLQSMEALSQKLLDDASREAETLKKEALLQAKDQLYQMKLDFEAETKERRGEYNQWEKRLAQKEDGQEKRSDSLASREQDITRRESAALDQEKHIDAQTKQADELLARRREKLEQVGGLTEAQAKEQLVAAIESEAKHDAAIKLKLIEQETKEQAKKQAQKILGVACQRYAGDYVQEKTVSVINLPNDEMKGRIIGREGRNIRAIEAATGIDLIIDDTPEAVILSGFNPLRREIARLSLERLISDGRIHPARIEEVVKKATVEVEGYIKEAGEQATFDVGVHGINPEIVKLLGRLRYRSSYAQNVLEHSLEVSFLCGIMASELGLNPKHAKRAGLLHDIGKAVDHEVEGGHAVIGADLAKRYGEKPNIIHAIGAHHEDIPPETVLAVLVQAADALSGARPGARREMLENYVKRLEELERIANSFEGVSKSYAIQAGREVRIMLDADKSTDDQALLTAREVARRIEEDMMYPGQIKVTVLRETRAVDYAK